MATQETFSAMKESMSDGKKIPIELMEVGQLIRERSDAIKQMRKDQRALEIVGNTFKDISNQIKGYLDGTPRHSKMVFSREKDMIQIADPTPEKQIEADVMQALGGRQPVNVILPSAEDLFNLVKSYENSRRKVGETTQLLANKGVEL